MLKSETVARIKCEAESIAHDLLEKWSGSPIRVGCILGTGLGHLLEYLSAGLTVCRYPYSQFPKLGATSVEGHKGEFVFTTVADEPVAILNGRFHLYEGRPYDAAIRVRRLTEVLIRLCRGSSPRLVVTNAGGYDNEAFAVGDFMVVNGYFDRFVETVPLAPCDGFPYADHALHPYLREIALAGAHVFRTTRGLRVQKGTLSWTKGPHLGGAANAKAARTLGIDAVGMSSWPESLIAAVAKVPVLALTLLTDKAGEPSSHERHLAVGRAASDKLLAWLEFMISAWRQDRWYLEPWPETKPAEAQAQS